MEVILRAYCPRDGWAVDVDPENDPTYPVRNRDAAVERGYCWQRPSQQVVDIEVLQSIERPNMSAVFGTSTPPSGLSGALRRFAYRYGESSYAHWLPLLVANRVNVVEGLLDDLSHAQPPNIFKELGWRAQWYYDRRRFVTRLGTKAALLGSMGALTYFGIRRQRAEDRNAPRRTLDVRPLDEAASPFLIPIEDLSQFAAATLPDDTARTGAAARAPAEAPPVGTTQKTDRELELVARGPELEPPPSARLDREQAKAA